PVRFVSRSLVALSLAALMSAGASAESFGARQPSVTGAYLAGSQALADLRTSDAARYFRDALSVDWENPIIVERAFVAYAANGEVDEAAETARRLLDIQHDNDLARLVVATKALRER